jgi:hypothetical protein
MAGKFISNLLAQGGAPLTRRVVISATENKPILGGALGRGTAAKGSQK